MAILESVRELASKLGAETNGRDITDQINKINKHLDETALGGRDIADAVRTYSKNASGGGGGGETFEVEMTFTAESMESQTGTAAVSKTLAEAIDAIDSGNNLVFTVNVTFGEETATLPFLGYKKFTASGIEYILIAAARPDGNGIYAVTWAADSTTVAISMSGFSGFGILP